MLLQVISYFDFSRIIMESFPLVPTRYLVSDSLTLCTVRYGLHLIKWALKAMGKYLLTPITFMTLLNK